VDPPPETPTRTCAVTGTSGYVGSRVARRLAAAGWQVRALTRTRAQGADWAQVHFALGEEVPPTALAGVDALVHVAYDFAPTRWREIWAVNVEGSRRLLAAAHAAGVQRIVTMSTTAAFPGCSSLYGRAKLEIELAALEAGAAAIRPGLVWGPQGAAMFGALQGALARLPIVPQPVPRELVLNLVHEDDLAALVQGILERWPAGSGRLYVAASARTLAFSELLRSLTPRAGRRPLVVRLPWRAVWAGLRTLEALGVPPPFSSDNLVSIAAIDRDPLGRATDGVERYGVLFRPYALR
jgi:nucleoside-diphosphate-sugar epimerase